MAGKGFEDLLRKHGFIIGILLSIICASIYPPLGFIDGPLNPKVTAHLLATWVIFFSTGLSLTGDELTRCLSQHKLNAFIQLTGFLVMPACVVFYASLLGYFLSVNEWLVKGFIVLASLPPPLAPTLVLTRYCNGNQAATVYNALLSNMLALLLQPITLYIYLGSTTLLPISETLNNISILNIIVPIALAQFVRRVMGRDFHRKLSDQSRRIDIVAQLALLYIIYVEFCQTLGQRDMEIHASTLLAAVLFVLLFQITSTWLVFEVANRVARFPREDIITAVFCSTQKSLTIGNPTLRILYSGYVHLAMISLPLLINQPTQLIVAALASLPFHAWLYQPDATY